MHTPQDSAPHNASTPEGKNRLGASSLLSRLRRTWPYFRGSIPGIWAALAAATVAACTEPMIPALLKPLLDRGFSSDRFPMWMVPAALLGLFFIRGASSFLAHYALAWSTHRATVELRLALFNRLLDAAPSLYNRHSASALTNTVVYEVQQGAVQLGSSLLGIVKDSLTIFALLGYLLWLNWKLTLAVLLLAPAVAGVMRVVSRRLQRLVVAGQDATDRLAYVVEENVLAWRIVRLHEAGQKQRDRFETENRHLRSLMLKAVAAGASSSPITQLLAAVAVSGVITAAIWQQEQASVGGFVAFITAMLLLLAPLKHLSDATAPLSRGLAALERGLELIEGSPAESGGTHQASGGVAQGDIAFRGVTLVYKDDSHPALQGIDLQVSPGETLALVGASGSGKSSLVQLLPRFLEPSQGVIELDGVALRQWDLRALRRQFAYVSQDVVLFNDTVAANVALGGDGSHPDEQARIEMALKHAHLLDFVNSLPQGLHTVIGHNGSELSGGQRQRLAIARALYKNAPVLILDEATSALDSESERAVQQALETLMKGRTTIVIAHRLSTIEHADRVVVLEGGRVVESGPAAELLQQQGIYARLHALQFRS